jgi:ureidoglycolate lyase
MIINPEPLMKETFSPFGEVLETVDVVPELINFGNTRKYGDLAEVTLAEGGRAQLSIYRSSAVELPFRIQLMERHPLGSQAFFPLHDRPFPVVVAPPDELPCATNIRVFLSNGRQGVNLHPGVWHHYQLTLGQDSDYIVFDRNGAGGNYSEHHLDEELILDL